MQRRPAILTHGVAVFALLLVLLVGLLAAPAAAFAREYSIPRVRIYAALQADGTLEVTEDRTYDFNGEYHGVYWDLSRDGGEGSDLAIAVRSCGIVSGSDYSTFEQSDSNSDGTYTVSDMANDNGTPITRVTLYSTNEDTWVIFRIVYTVTGVATRYGDVGELYWKFVSDGWEVPSENVVCTVDLPVPLAETISVGNNVQVWAHGPLSGTITTGGDRVRATVPSVSSGEYAELRVTMPSSWLLDMDAVDEERLDTILQEEKGWAEETNARGASACASASVARSASPSRPRGVGSLCGPTPVSSSKNASFAHLLLPNCGISLSDGSAPKTMRAAPYLPSPICSANPTQNWPS